jgi:hypothetical protein
VNQIDTHGYCQFTTRTMEGLPPNLKRLLDLKDRQSASPNGLPKRVDNTGSGSETPDIQEIPSGYNATTNSDPMYTGSGYGPEI